MRFDVIVVGAGIPGLYAARELARTGRTVLLLESSQKPELPNYSTAGVPAETISEFGLPLDAVNSPIRHQVVGSSRIETRKTARDGHTFAYVLDFGKTKRRMGEQCIEAGARVHYGEKALEWSSTNGLQSVRTTKSTYFAPDVIDASGSNGALACQAGIRIQQIDRLSVGMEYRIRTKEPSLSRFSETIATYFDEGLLPHGYGWIFADGPDVYKVGLIEYWVDSARGLPPLKHRLDGFVKWLGVDLADPAYENLETHGGSKLISHHFKRVRADRLYAIGDTIGAINPLLAEGIRQGLVSARHAIDAIIRGTPEHYDREWKKFQGRRWKMAELFARLCYENPRADFIDAIVRISEKMSSEELRRLVFHYEFEWIFRRAPLESLKALAMKRSEIAKLTLELAR